MRWFPLMLSVSQNMFGVLIYFEATIANTNITALYGLMVLTLSDLNYSYFLFLAMQLVGPRCCLVG